MSICAKGPQKFLQVLELPIRYQQTQYCRKQACRLTCSLSYPYQRLRIMGFMRTSSIAVTVIHCILTGDCMFW
ncbi:hypothetical protein GIB67_034875 [Kingdonia uniflora]|uniref:Uncharacterized protein n=1 Tax=Kingdonia uniflora TaxID=39325 RepID=A0A7J7MZ24_9MAGN|nr:hypothetical protein GIB67_034875 [Kingdonia uniflora]